MCHVGNMAMERRWTKPSVHWDFPGVVFLLNQERSQTNPNSQHRKDSEQRDQQNVLSDRTAQKYAGLGLHVLRPHCNTTSLESHQAGYNGGHWNIGTSEHVRFSQYILSLALMQPDTPYTFHNISCIYHQVLTTLSDLLTKVRVFLTTFLLVMHLGLSLQERMFLSQIDHLTSAWWATTKRHPQGGAPSYELVYKPIQLQLSSP